MDWRLPVGEVVVAVVRPYSRLHIRRLLRSMPTVGLLQAPVNVSITFLRPAAGHELLGPRGPQELRSSPRRLAAAGLRSLHQG